MIKYNIVRTEDAGSIAVQVNGKFLVADSSHPNFNEIVRLAVADDDSVEDLFDLNVAVERKFRRISERVTFESNTLYFDGEPMDSTMADLAVRFIREGSDFGPIIAFMENVMQNPNEHSRRMLFDWLRQHDFTINSDGNIVAYKGVVATDGSDVYHSISAGTAIADGLEITGAIPQSIGTVVEMPRSKVQHDPATGCSTGLHAGTWSYASGFARGAVLTVEINPRDVVSVPTDCSWQKLRTCRYTVVDVTEQELPVALHGATERIDDYGYDWETEFDEDWADDSGWEDDWVDEDYSN